MNARIGDRFINEGSGRKYVLAHVNRCGNEDEVKLINLEEGTAWSFRKTTVQNIHNIHPNELEVIFGNNMVSFKKIS